MSKRLEVDDLANTEIVNHVTMQFCEAWYSNRGLLPKDFGSDRHVDMLCCMFDTDVENVHNALKSAMWGNGVHFCDTYKEARKYAKRIHMGEA